MYQFARNVAQIEGNETKPSCLQEEIGGAKTLFHGAAAHPQQLLEVDSGGFRGVRIEGVTAINQGACFRMSWSWRLKRRTINLCGLSKEGPKFP